MIADKLKVLEVREIKRWVPSYDMREEVARVLLDKQEAIESTFKDDEYLKIDLTNAEIVGLKSHAKLGEMPIGDLPAINYVLAHDDKYKNANLLNLGNVEALYKKYEL